MNKVFISGTAVGSELNLCEPCLLDFSWLIKKPDTLVWADKIVITKKALDKYLSKNNTKTEKTIKLILEIAKDNNILEIVEINENLKRIAEPYFEKGVEDFKMLMKTFQRNTNSVKKDTFVEEINIGNEYYCLPYITSLYTQIGIANKIGANCLFGERDYTYLKHISKVDKARIFNEVFRIYFPCELIHSYAFEEENRCQECSKVRLCQENYLKETENNMFKILKWRDYDEIYMAKKEIDKIIKLQEKSKGCYDVEEIKKDFIEKQKKINRNIKKVFPKIKRWTNLATVISTPVTIYSVANSNMTATLLSAGIGGVSKVIEEGLKYYENKNNWVSFINKEYKTS